MDETTVRSLLAVAAGDEDAPPCRVSIPLARSHGRRRIRLRRIYLPAAAPVAAAVAVALVITLPVALGGGSSSRGLAPVRPRPAAPAAAPSSFNPLVPYASFGWLPAGFSANASAGVTDQMTSHSVTLQAAAPPADGRMVVVTVDAAGTCRIVATPAAIKAAGPAAAPARTLSCTDPSAGGGNRFAELASAAPDVNGEPGYWTLEGALEFEYAPGAWAEVLPMGDPAMCSPTCAGGNLAGWINMPATTARARPGVPAAKLVQVQPEAQSAATKALLLKIAASLRYGDATPLVFGFTLAGLATGWQPSDSYSYAPLDGRLAASGWSAGPASDPTALNISLGPSVSASSDYACKFVAGQSTAVTLDGAPALLRNLDEPEKHWQSLCANDLDGVQPYLTLDLNVPGSNTPLPGGTEVSSVLALFQRVRLLGPDPAAWVTDPLG